VKIRRFEEPFGGYERYNLVVKRPLSSPIYDGILHLISSIGIVFLATLIFLPLRPIVGIEIIALLYLLPLGVISTLWDIRVSILSAVLSFFTLNFTFIPPYYTLYVHRPQDLVILMVFLGVSLFISQLMGRLRQSLQVARSREMEAICLFDFMVQLAALTEEQAVLDALVRQVHQAVHAEYVLARLELKTKERDEPEILSSQWSAEDEFTPPTDPPTICFPFQVTQPSGGEICIWRRKKPFLEAEKRFLQLFISQASLAMERIRLGRAELQSRVLAESNRLKTSLLSSVSHELRTPLAAIKAAISSLNQSGVELAPETRAELLKLVEEETDHLNLLVGNLLNMSRLEAGALTLERSWSNLKDIVLNAIRRTAPYSSAHQIVTSFPPNLPSLHIDFLLIEQVMLNLLHNSLKHSPEGSTIEIVVFPPDNDFIRVEVRNQSPPIPPEHLERIFDKFYRLEQPQRVQGTGLGLAICKGIIEAHGGMIWAENRSQGIAFVFTLPLRNHQNTRAVVELKEGKI